MNIFRLCGDMSHLLSICILLLQLWRAKNARGKKFEDVDGQELSVGVGGLKEGGD